MMVNRTSKIDLFKLFKYILKRIWLVAICAAIGFGGMYYYLNSRHVETYTARGTMYIFNANPNLVNYQYASISDLNSAVQLLDTYTVLLRSDKVMEVVAENLSQKYQSITAQYIAGTISMASVSETSVFEVRCRTVDPQMSMDICNEVMAVAPAAIKEIVGAGQVNPIDPAELPRRPDSFSPWRRSFTGGLAGAAVAIALLSLLFILNRKITDTKDLTENYTPPVLASILRNKKESNNPSKFLISSKSPMEVVEGYAKLRMNLLYTLVNKESKTIEVTSAIAGEGKSTISANLAISVAMSGKRVVLIDGDLRRASQRAIFGYSKKHKGLSEALVGLCTWQETIINSKWDNLDILPTGQIPPNPAEMLGSEAMISLLRELEQNYDLVVLDAPPINIVSDPLVLSSHVSGCLFVTRQNFSDQREIRKALNSAEMTGMNVLGFAFYGENLRSGGYYYNKRYYSNYYHVYDSRGRAKVEPGSKDEESGEA